MEWGEPILSGQCRFTSVASAEPVGSHKRLQQGQLQSTSGLQTPVICPRDTAAQAGTSSLPPKVSLKYAGHASRVNAWSREGTGQGWLLGNEPTVGNLWVGQGRVPERHWVGRLSHQVIADSELAMWWDCSTQARWHLSVDCLRGGSEKGTMATISPAFIPFFPHMSLMPSELLTLCQSPGCL